MNILSHEAGYDRYKLALFREYKEYTHYRNKSEQKLFFPRGGNRNKTLDQLKSLPSPLSFKVSFQQFSSKSYQNCLNCTQEDLLSEKVLKACYPQEPLWQFKMTYSQNSPQTDCYKTQHSNTKKVTSALFRTSSDKI